MSSVIASALLGSVLIGANIGFWHTAKAAKKTTKESIKQIAKHLPKQTSNQTPKQTLKQTASIPDNNNALRKQSLLLANLSQQETEAGRPINAILLALEALPKNMNKPDKPYVAQAEAALYNALVNYHKFTEFKGHKDIINDAVFSRDGRFIASASSDKTARVWDAVTGKTLLVLAGHTGAVTGVDFSPAAENIVTSSSDGTVRLWESATGKQLNSLDVGEEVNKARLSKDGKLAFITGKNFALVWDIASNKTGFKWQNIEMPMFDGNDKYLAACEKNMSDGQSLEEVSVWDVYSGNRLFSLPKAPGICTDRKKFSPNSEYLAVTSNFHAMTVWNLVTNTAVLEKRMDGYGFWDVDFAADKKQMLFISQDVPPNMARYRPNEINLFDIEKNRIDHIHTNIEDAIFAKFLSFSTYGYVLEKRVIVQNTNPLPTITGYTEKKVDVSDYKTLTPDPKLANTDSAVQDIVFSPDGKLLLMRLTDNTLLALNHDRIFAVPESFAEQFPEGNLKKYQQAVAKLEKFGLRICAIDDEGKVAASCNIAGERKSFEKNGELWMLGDMIERGYEPNVAAMPTDTQNLIDFARASVPRQLTREQRKQFFLDE